MKGICFNIQRYAIHDGPGIRTTVFFKGCPMSCAWCHNPEGLSGDPEVLLIPDRCMACGDCEEICPNPPPVGSPGRADSDRIRCEGCGGCADVCPTGARRLVGDLLTVAEVMREVERDAPFYRQTGGGVTFSGGEPLMQGSFLLECMRECRRQGLHVAVDTCGLAGRELVLQVQELADLFLYDLKILGSDRHRLLTGSPLEPILENLRTIDAAGAQAIIRFPLIPGVTDGQRNIESLGEFVMSLKNTRIVHILPFHKTASDKYHRLGRRWSYGGVTPLSRMSVENVISVLSAYGLTATAGGWIYDGKSQEIKKTKSGG